LTSILRLMLLSSTTCTGRRKEGGQRVCEEWPPCPQTCRPGLRTRTNTCNLVGNASSGSATLNSLSEWRDFREPTEVNDPSTCVLATASTLVSRIRLLPVLLI